MDTHVGGIQNATLTLQSTWGNAMDISSLLMALLRVSDIPARYVHGTIDVPADSFQNWAGGFARVDLAANYAASGGIPITSLVSGGTIVSIRMEHIWVEAAIDFFPSRGARNRSADAWLGLDPSFKQYEHQEGVDVLRMSGIDVGQLAQDFVASGTVNEGESWFSGFNAAIVENAHRDTARKLQDYFQTHLPTPSIADVIGRRTIMPHDVSVLPSAHFRHSFEFLSLIH